MYQPVGDVASIALGTDFVPRHQQRPGRVPDSSLGETDASCFQLLTVGGDQNNQRDVGGSLEHQIEHELGARNVHTSRSGTGRYVTDKVSRVDRKVVVASSVC